MENYRYTGHNVAHLIYPLRIIDEENNTNIGGILKKDKNNQWEDIYHIEDHKDNNQDTHQNNINYIFSKEYNTDIPKEKNSLREWIKNEQLHNYFHPSVQNILFNKKNDKNKGLKVYRLKKEERQIFLGEFKTYNSRDNKFELEDKFLFEWLSSEIYVFSGKSAFLVVRISMLENYLYNDTESKIEENIVVFNKNTTNDIVHNLPLNIWTKFINRIRQNFEKYTTQNRIVLSELKEISYLEDNKVEVKISSEKSENLFNFIEKILPLSLKISTKSFSEKKESDDPLYRRIEPNAFIHAFVQSNITNPNLSTDELYQLTLIDDYDGESGGTKEFKEEFLKNKLYCRWVPYTYYTGIDYGSVTIADNNKVCYSNSKHSSEFADLLYQHHTKHYLIIIVLILYYRDELQELMGRYAKIQDLSRDRDEEEARKILDDYYYLNQHYFFDRLTNEIQGSEMFKFYKVVMETKELYFAVQEDMHELNQRLIEQSTEKQNENVKYLTIVAAITGMLGMNLIIGKVSTSEIIKNASIDDGSLISNIIQLAENFLPKINIGLNIIAIVAIVLILGYLFKYIGKKIIKCIKK